MFSSEKSDCVHYVTMWFHYYYNMHVLILLFFFVFFAVEHWFAK